MAKKEKASKKAEKTEAAEKTAEFKYGVLDIADALDIKPASVRVQLRNKGIEKNGKSYGWNSKSELNEVIAQLRSSTSNDDEDEAPARKSKKSKAEKPAKGKKAKRASTKRARDEDEDEDDD